MEFEKNMKVLTEDEVYRIHMNVMEVLWQIGIMVEEKQSLQLLEKNGAKVDYEKQRAYLPADLVQHCMSVKGHSFSFYDAFGKKVIDYGGTRTYYSTCGYTTTYVDQDGTSKEGSYAALEKAVRYVETIDEIDMMQPSIQACDIPSENQDLYMTKALLVNTRKPTHAIANSEKHAEGLIMMHAEIAGGLENLMKKPRHLFNICTFSPLGIRKDACEVIRTAAKYNIPCEFSTGTMAGATAPVTLAASIVEAFAEVIGHIVLAQCYRPGLNCSLLSANRIFDMKFAACTVATPEYAVIKTAACQMAHYYRIPIGCIGPCSDSNEHDAQFGWEKFMGGFVCRQAGSNMEFGIGLYSQLNQFSYTCLALDAELIRNLEKIGRGMEVSDFTLAFDVLEEDAGKGEFLFHNHTLDNYKDEFLAPVLTDRAPYPNYQKRNGKNTLVDRANKQLDKYEKAYNYTKGREHEAELQKILDEYAD